VLSGVDGTLMTLIIMIEDDFLGLTDYVEHSI